jgi:hypothetical protein
MFSTLFIQGISFGPLLLHTLRRARGLLAATWRQPDTRTGPDSNDPS